LVLDSGLESLSKLTLSAVETVKAGVQGFHGSSEVDSGDWSSGVNDGQIPGAAASLPPQQSFEFSEDDVRRPSSSSSSLANGLFAAARKAAEATKQVKDRT
jgi:hypothetical protein